MTKKTRTYVHPFCGEVTWESINDAIKEIYLNYLNHRFDKIILPISTSGGDPDAAWSLYTTLKNINCNSIALANGRVFSAGIIIFLGCKKRYSFKESIFLFHPTTIVQSINEESSLAKLEEIVVGEKLDSKIFKEILSKELTGASKNDINNLTSQCKSAFVNAEKAQELGLVHKIITDISDI